ncbi:hypothetical protein C5167_024816 [Papaver somniferum]|uniref:Uncharacterized protein n=1 Tax=Papaver somniferum TaxID=3469 RepID=A0A4Y7JPM6_PAPSO|nr:hypothetical protein C5167_024816 [Papaver somniferum]
MRCVSIEKFQQKSGRMTSDFMEIIQNGLREDYKYSDANRERMKDILNNPSNFTEDEKINTLVSFHKDTCANVLLQLYPSIGDDDACQDAFEDLKILKKYVSVLDELEFENKRSCLYAMYQQLRANKRYDYSRSAMSGLLESPDAQLPEDIKNQILQNLGCHIYDYDVDDDVYDVYDDDNDDEDKEYLRVEREISVILAELRRLGVDISEYQDSDSNEDPKFMDNQPITQATIDHYTLMEEEVKRRSDEMVQVLEDVNPIAGGDRRFMGKNRNE